MIILRKKFCEGINPVVHAVVRTEIGMLYYFHRGGGIVYHVNIIFFFKIYLIVFIKAIKSKGALIVPYQQMKTTKNINAY